MSALEALRRLRDGNARFVRAARSGGPIALRGPAAGYSRSQNPIAVVVGCSDSRVAPEVVLGQGLGDVFVVRVAGHVASGAVVESVGFALEAFSAPLVVVLGHSGCAAVTSAIEHSLRRGAGSATGGSLVDLIRPAVAPLLTSDEDLDEEELMWRAVRANVTYVADTLRRVVLGLTGELRSRTECVGAVYSLDTYVVDFFDGVEALEQWS